MNKLRLFKHIIYRLFFYSFLTILGIWGCYFWVEQQTKLRVYSDVNAIPAKSVALVLGTSKYTRNGLVNLYFKYRIEATVALFKAKKIRHIIVSGDNNTKAYNEPINMYNALIKKGIPSKAISLDYAGFRTLDSVIRVKEIFSQDDIIIISQAFHNKRAIFISDFYHINAIGFNAQDVPFPATRLRMQLREYLARCKAVLDLYILNTQPKFLGEKVHIPL